MPSLHGEKVSNLSISHGSSSCYLKVNHINMINNNDDKIKLKRNI